MVVLLCGTAVALAQYRQQFGERDAGALEAAVGAVFRGGAIEWTRDPYVVLADGTKPGVRFSGIDAKSVGDRELYVVAVEFQSRTLGEAEGLSMEVAGGRTELWSFETKDGALLGRVQKEAVAGGALVSRCIELRIVTTDQTWIAVAVYRAAFRQGAGIAVIDWQERIAGSNLGTIERVPLRVWPSRAQGGKADLLAMERQGDKLRVVGRMSGQELEFDCNESCVVDLPSFLEKWNHLDR